MPWIWSDQLASLPDLAVSQRVRDLWTQRPVAVREPEGGDLGSVATALAADDEEPPLVTVALLAA